MPSFLDVSDITLFFELSEHLIILRHESQGIPASDGIIETNIPIKYAGKSETSHRYTAVSKNKE